MNPIKHLRRVAAVLNSLAADLVAFGATAALAMPCPIPGPGTRLCSPGRCPFPDPSSGAAPANRAPGRHE